jgi:GR25 family glycosyltransferase involved in LPS biosynthesis
MLWIIIILIIVVLSFFLKKHYKYTESFENYLNGIDIVYWINLDRSPDRRESMEKMFKDSVFDGIPQKRISGVDGKKDNIYEMIEVKEYSANDSEYGCLLSHLNAIKEFNESNYEIALILEDDCTLELKKYWKKSIKQIIQNAPSDWEIIMLSYYLPDNHPFNKWENDDYTSNIPYSTLSYIINKKGATKLITDCNNLSCYKDNYYLLNSNSEHKSDHYIFKNTITYCYKYPLFIYGDGESTIHNDQLHPHKENKNKIIENYKKLNQNKS